MNQPRLFQIGPFPDLIELVGVLKAVSRQFGMAPSAKLCPLDWNIFEHNLLFHSREAELKALRFLEDVVTVRGYPYVHGLEYFLVVHSLVHNGVD